VNPVREILVRRIRCPSCASDRHRVYGKRDELHGDCRRYCRCLDCGCKFHVIESDSEMFNHVEARWDRAK
jgi:hypothetical protein